MVERIEFAYIYAAAAAAAVANLEAFSLPDAGGKGRTAPVFEGSKDVAVDSGRFFCR